MYAGAFIPGFTLTALYAGYVLILTFLKPGCAPALPPEARSLREPNGDSGTTSLLFLVIVAIVVAIAVGHYYRPEAPTDERLVSSIFSGVSVAFLAAVVNRLLTIGLLRRLAERLAFFP